jgi:hypothetical protein
VIPSSAEVQTPSGASLPLVPPLVHIFCREAMAGSTCEIEDGLLDSIPLQSVGSVFEYG